MKSICLLILSVMSGFGASADVKGCSGGWVEFTCKYPNNINDGFKVFVNGTLLKAVSAKNNWEEQDRFSLYHDTNKKNLRLIIRDLKTKDSGIYHCGLKLNQVGLSEMLKVVENKSCQTPVYQGVYKHSNTTIRCDDQDQNPSLIKFFCKENQESICEEILSQSSQKPNKTFSLKNTTTGFNVTVSKFSGKDEGVYWCGVKEKNGLYRAGIKKIQLNEIITFNKNPTAGESLAFYCEYKIKAENKTKFICKGENQSTCQVLADTNHTKSSRFSMKDDKTTKISVTLSDVTASDSGTYWCGAENTDGKMFTHRMSLKVPKPPAPPATGVSNFLQVVITGAVGLILLLLLIVSLFICTKYFSSKSSEITAETKEEYVNIYEEIPERLQTSAVYATAQFPADVSSPSLNYSTVVLPNGSSDGVLVLRSGSTSCQYSVLNCGSSSSSLTVQPPGSTEQPLYSTVQKSQQE